MEFGRTRFFNGTSRSDRESASDNCTRHKYGPVLISRNVKGAVFCARSSSSFCLWHKNNRNFLRQVFESRMSVTNRVNRARPNERHFFSSAEAKIICLHSEPFDNTLGASATAFQQHNIRKERPTSRAWRPSRTTTEWLPSTELVRSHKKLGRLFRFFFPKNINVEFFVRRLPSIVSGVTNLVPHSNRWLAVKRSLWRTWPLVR